MLKLALGTFRVTGRLRRLLAQHRELIRRELRHPAGIIFGQAGQGATAAAAYYGCEAGAAAKREQ